MTLSVSRNPYTGLPDLVGTGGGGAGYTAGLSNIGNTSGNTGAVTGRLILAGGNNITLSGSTNGGSMTVAISGAAGGGAAFSAGASNVGNTSGNTGTVSNQIVFAGGNNITLSQSTAAGGVTLTISAFNQSQFVLSDSNGLAWGTNGSTVTGSYTVPTQSVESQSIGMSNLGNTSGTTGIASGGQVRFVLAGGNNITLSQSLNGASGTITVSAFNQTVQTQNVVVPAASNSTITSGTAVFTGSNNITVSYNGQSIIISGPTTAAQTNQSLGIYGVGNTTGQSSSSTYDARSLSIDGAGIVSVGWSNSTFRISATQSNQAFSAAGGSSAFQTFSFADSNSVSFTNTNGSLAIASVKLQMYAVSNTTQSSSGTANHTALSFAGAGAASVGVTNGTVVVSVPTGGAGDGYNIIAAGTQTANTTGTVVFSNSNGVSFGMSNSSVVTASHAVNISAGTTSNALSDLRFSNSNGISFGLNASTITAMMPSVSYYEPFAFLTGQNHLNGTLQVQPVLVPFQISATQGRMVLHVSNQTNAGGTVTMSLGVYTLSGSTASLASSGSRTWGYNSTAANSSYTAISGTRYWTMDIGTWNLTPGHYLMAAHIRCTSSISSGTLSLFCRTAVSINAQAFGTANYDAFGMGLYGTSFTTAMPSSIHVTNINQSGGSANRQPWYAFFGTH